MLFHTAAGVCFTSPVGAQQSRRGVLSPRGVHKAARGMLHTPQPQGGPQRPPVASGRCSTNPRGVHKTAGGFCMSPGALFHKPKGFHEAVGRVFDKPWGAVPQAPGGSTNPGALFQKPPNGHGRPRRVFHKPQGAVPQAPWEPRRAAEGRSPWAALRRCSASPRGGSTRPRGVFHKPCSPVPQARRGSTRAPGSPATPFHKPRGGFTKPREAFHKPCGAVPQPQGRGGDVPQAHGGFGMASKMAQNPTGPLGRW